MIDWLRGLGVVRLSFPDYAHLSPPIPSHLFGPIAQCAPDDCADPPHPRARSVDDACATSFAGLARACGAGGILDELLAAVPRGEWPIVTVPLFLRVPPLLAGTSALEFTVLRDWNGTWPCIGTARHCRIDAAGLPGMQDYPVDRFGLGWGWAPRLPSRTGCPFRYWMT